MKDQNRPISDRLVHAGRPSGGEGRQVNMPIELGSTRVFDTMAAFDAARAARHESGTAYYGRYGSDAAFALERALAALEGADGVTLTSSGVSAITMTLTALVPPGAHLLVADNVYGNTRAFCENLLAPRGVDVEFFDPMIGAAVADLVRSDTTTLMFEAPGTGTFEVPDIPSIAGAARERGIVSVMDATWPTPIFCQPLGLGVDVVVSSGSKYLSGHSDVMIGTIAARRALHDRIRLTVHAFGDKPGAQEVFLALRGLRTLEMRMRHVDQAGRALAAWLDARPEIARTLHPAFPSCPGHDYWCRDFRGAAGLFSVVLKPTSDDAVRRFIDDLSVFGIGVSWGGYESLILPAKPVRTVTPWPGDAPLIRFNVGFENIDTLTADLSRALPHLHGGG